MGLQLEFAPLHNCWRIAHARRASLLIDAQAYYSALLSALRQARSRIIILAWDIDTRIDLGGGVMLGDALQEALDRNPELHIHVLCWNFSLIYVFERQLFPQFQKPFRHPRVHLLLDGLHPFGASQHQKIVVIDDQLAFVGGLDLCGRRWDTREHRATDSRRVDSNGKCYGPFHDVQAIVDGDAARSLGDLARERWRRVSPHDLIPESDAIAPIWPEGVVPRFGEAKVALARTMWPENGNPALHEVEQLYLDLIRAARRHVYIENQYFTCDSLANAVIERLAEPDCPEFLILLPRENSGWKEQSTMGVVRHRLIERVRRADIRGRLRFLYPVASPLGDEEPVIVNLHAKLMIVDNEVLRTGSSNLSNRSMGMDAECDIAIAAHGRRDISESIKSIRDSLMAEHLGVDESTVSALFRETGSLFETLDQIRDIPGRSHDLLLLEPWNNPWADMLVPRSNVIDPCEPSSFETVVAGVLFAVSGLGVLLTQPKVRRYFLG